MQPVAFASNRHTFVLPLKMLLLLLLLLMQPDMKDKDFMFILIRNMKTKIGKRVK